MNGTGLHVARLYHLSGISSLHGFDGSRFVQTHTRKYVGLPLSVHQQKINRAKAWEWVGDRECNAAAINELIEIAAYTWSLHQIILMSSNGLSRMKRKVSRNHYWISTPVFHHFQHNGVVWRWCWERKKIFTDKSRSKWIVGRNECANKIQLAWIGCAKREKESWIIDGGSTK